MASLYDIDMRLLTYEEQFDPETGEWINESELDDLKMEREEKIEQLLLWAKNLRAEAKAIKDEEGNLADRRKAKEKKADRIEDYVARNLDGQKFETPRVKIGWRKSERVIIPDEVLVPDRFCNHTVVRKPDKTIIKDYLKKAEANGEKVEWASIEVKNNMNVK